MFEFVRCSKNDVRVLSMFDKMVFDTSLLFYTFLFTEYWHSLNTKRTFLSFFTLHLSLLLVTSLWFLSNLLWFNLELEKVISVLCTCCCCSSQQYKVLLRLAQLQLNSKNLNRKAVCSSKQLLPSLLMKLSEISDFSTTGMMFFWLHLVKYCEGHYSRN